MASTRPRTAVFLFSQSTRRTRRLDLVNGGSALWGLFDDLSYDEWPRDANRIADAFIPMASSAPR